MGPCFESAPACTKVPYLWDVYVHFDCAGSHQTLGPFFLFPKVYFYRGAVLVFRSICPFSSKAWDIWDILSLFCVKGAGHRTLLHPCGMSGIFCALLTHWQVWAEIGKIERWFQRYFSWPAQYLVNLDDALKGSKVSFCETVVIFDLGRGDVFVRGRRSTSDHSGSFFVVGAVLRPQQKKCLKSRYTKRYLNII